MILKPLRLNFLFKSEGIQRKYWGMSFQFLVCKSHKGDLKRYMTGFIYIILLNCKAKTAAAGYQNKYPIHI